MSEGSLPPFKYLDPRRYPARVRDAAGRLIERFRRRGDRGEKLWDEPGASSGGSVELSSRDSSIVTYPGGAGITPGADEGGDLPLSGREIGKEEHAQVVAALREFIARNATNVERAARTRDQVQRLEIEGTPSDSARNRAARAREELVDGLARLRRSLYEAGGTELARVLDLEVTKLDPPIQPVEIHR